MANDDVGKLSSNYPAVNQLKYQVKDPLLAHNGTSCCHIACRKDSMI
jgi:hypothetical protein